MPTRITALVLSRSLAPDVYADLGGVVEDHPAGDDSGEIEDVAEPLADAPGGLAAEDPGGPHVGVRESDGGVPAPGDQHSDGGAVYMTDEWPAACAAGPRAARSMSRKARSPDNARCEGFFGTLKSDFFHGTDWRGVKFAEFRERLGAYIEWRGGVKPKKALGGGR